MTTDERVLKCYTNRSGCCDDYHTREGEWQFPNGSNVSRFGDGSNFFYKNRGTNVVKLNWRNDSMIPPGIYCCMIPSVTQIACSGIYRENEGNQLLFCITIILLNLYYNNYSYLFFYCI